MTKSGIFTKAISQRLLYIIMCIKNKIKYAYVGLILLSSECRCYKSFTKNVIIRENIYKYLSPLSIMDMIQYPKLQRFFVLKIYIMNIILHLLK